MATDNVDIFKKIIFSIPSGRELVAATVISGAVASGLNYYTLKLFAGNLLPAGFLGPHHLPALLIGFYLAPPLLSGELLYRLLPQYPRHWGYFLSLSNQSAFFFYFLILSGADNLITAWNILWLGVITVFLSNILVLTLTVGYSYLKRISVLSLVQPLTILFSFHLILGRALPISFLSYVYSLGVFLFAGVMLALIILTVEYLAAANIEGLTAMWLTSGLLQKRQEKLDIGYPTEPDVQTLEIQNSSDKARLCIPWIHPGPLEGFGGGRITTDIIEELNEDGTGFFLHVPSTHKSDPSDPQDYEKILEAMEKPGQISRASKLVKKESGEITFYGRRIDGKKIVFLSPGDSGYDDYELSVFREVVDPENVVIVDLHNHPRNQGERNEVWYNTETAERLREELQEFLDELESLETYGYRAGFSVDLSGTPTFALVEEVDGQRTVLYGVEGNEAGHELLGVGRELEEEFDEVLPFTTDTHRSIHELSRDEQVERNRLERTVEDASGSVSDASIGFTSTRAEEMKLLGEDYSGLMFSINILVRLVPISLVALYIALAVWIF